eukprot:GHVT01002618.1.p1 GENE.GHVT01002618.1~~GHVT01002618.1.p1  ORF type:complete len:333 (-),score=83.06 GHVT01002618.1:1888-2886(-)
MCMFQRAVGYPWSSARHLVLVFLGCVLSPLVFRLSACASSSASPAADGAASSSSAASSGPPASWFSSLKFPGGFSARGAGGGGAASCLWYGETDASVGAPGSGFYEHVSTVASGLAIPWAIEFLPPPPPPAGQPIPALTAIITERAGKVKIIQTAELDSHETNAKAAAPPPNVVGEEDAHLYRSPTPDKDDAADPKGIQFATRYPPATAGQGQEFTATEVPHGLPVIAEGEAGLLGLAVSPDFAWDPQFERNNLFLFYTTTFNNDPLVARVAKFNLAATANATHIIYSLGTDTLNLVGDLPANRTRTGGGMAIGPDGMLYIGGSRVQLGGLF